MSEYTKIELDNGAYTMRVWWDRETRTLSIWPQFRDSSDIPLGNLLRGLGITLDDCKKALEEQSGILQGEEVAV